MDLSRRQFGGLLAAALVPPPVWDEQDAPLAVQRHAERVIGKDAQRDVRLLYFTQNGCQPCRMIAARFPGLRRSGWEIGAGVDKHIQILDIKDDDTWFDLYKVRVTPTFILLDGAGPAPKIQGRLTLRGNSATALLDRAVTMYKVYTEDKFQTLRQQHMPADTEWTHPGSGLTGLVDHLVQMHQFARLDTDGIPYGTLKRLHNREHNLLRR